MSLMLVVFSFLVAVLLLSASNLSPSSSQLVTQFEQGPIITSKYNLKTEIVSRGAIKFPTSMAFLAPNDILVLEKNEGTVKRVVNGVVLSEPLLDVNVANKNERGMLGIAIDTKHFFGTSKNLSMTQNLKSNGVYVFLYYTESAKKDGDDVTEDIEPLGNRLYRYELVNNKLAKPKLLLDLPTTPTGVHNGGKIVIGPDNNIYLTIGDLGIFNTRQEPSQVQNIRNGLEPNGSGGILRITQNGQVVDGGILGKEHLLNLYFAYGIRNSFGIDFDPVTGNLWDTENGPEFGDEINLVKPGFNSGWGDIQGFWNHEGGKALKGPLKLDKLEDFNGKGNYSSPEFVWNTTVGVTDLKFLNSEKLGKIFENDIFVGDFHTGNLYHIDLTNDRTGLYLENSVTDKIANTTAQLREIRFGNGFGGITDLEVGPDGYLYIVALNFGGGNCDPKLPNEPCVSYNGPNIGTIFRIVPIK